MCNHQDQRAVATLITTCDSRAEDFCYFVQAPCVSRTSDLAAVLWPTLDYKVTFISRQMTFMQSVTNAPDAPVFLQELIYIAVVMLLKPIVVISQ